MQLKRSRININEKPLHPIIMGNGGLCVLSFMGKYVSTYSIMFLPGLYLQCLLHPARFIHFNMWSHKVEIGLKKIAFPFSVLMIIMI